MFDFIREEPTDIAVAGVYYAVRLLRHLAQLKDISLGYTVEGLAAEPDESARLLSNRIVLAIEQQEGRRLSELPKEAAELYSQTLAGIIQQLVKERLQYEESRGDELLRQLRSEY